MKKKSNILLWIFSIMFLLTGFYGMTESIIAGLLLALFGLSLCPALWKVIQSKRKTKCWMKIVVPIALFFLAGVSMPPSTSQNQPLSTTAVAEAKTVAEEKKLDSNSTEPDTENAEVTVMAESDDASNSEQIDELTVHFINVGQGDATLMICGDDAMLIDAGDNNKGTTVQSYLQKQGVSNLKYVIGTHPDSDHIGGLDVIVTKFNCDTIIMPDYTKDTATYRDVIDAMKYKGYKNTVPVVGEKYRLGDAEFTIIAPNGTYSEPNINSVGIILQHGKRKLLFTGDAEEKAEADILSNGIDISCDVYQVGHHGSNTSSSIALLDAAKPTYAVISCGEGNKYGHPRAETLNNFRSRGIKVYRTDEQGTIIAKSDGNTIVFDESPSESWKAGEPTGSSNTSIESNPVATETIKATVTPTEAPTQEAQKVSTTYVLNTSSKKFHRLSCGSLPTKNRKDTEMSRDEIISKGYVPCKKCNP